MASPPTISSLQPIVASNTPAAPQMGLRPSFPESANSSAYLPSLPHAISVAFRHPAYQDQTNILFRLPAFDSGDSVNWGIHHDTALTACSIISCNIRGFLSPTRLESLAPRPAVPPSDTLLMSRSYYFYPLTWCDAETTEDMDLRYPVCGDFMDWQFPLNDFPPKWVDIEVSANKRIHFPISSPC